MFHTIQHRTVPAAFMLLAVILGAAAALTVLANGAEAQSGPSVTLSKTVVNPDGDTIVVTGTGFLPSLATGTRPPLAGQPAGTYVAFGAFAENWKPSEGAPASARPSIPQADGGVFWAVPEASRSIIGEANSVTLNPDGSFTATITVKRGYSGALADGRYGIYTYPGSGAVQPLYETFTPITFTGEAGASPTTQATAASTVAATATATAAAVSTPQAPRTGSGNVPDGQESIWPIIAIALASAAAGMVLWPVVRSRALKR